MLREHRCGETRRTLTRQAIKRLKKVEVEGRREVRVVGEVEVIERIKFEL